LERQSFVVNADVHPVTLPGLDDENPTSFSNIAGSDLPIIPMERDMLKRFHIQMIEIGGTPTSFKTDVPVEGGPHEHSNRQEHSTGY
jgi:hypothetical protein